MTRRVIEPFRWRGFYFHNPMAEYCCIGAYDYANIESGSGVFRLDVRITCRTDSVSAYMTYKVPNSDDRLYADGFRFGPDADIIEALEAALTKMQDKVTAIAGDVRKVLAR